MVRSVMYSANFEYQLTVVLRYTGNYTVSRKKGATDFFAVTFTNIDGFS